MLPEGWEEEDDGYFYDFINDEEQEEPPEGSIPAGIIAIANAIPTIRRMVSVNILNNNINKEQALNLVAVLKEHPTLKSLCGNKGDETNLDMSGKNMGTEDAIMLVPEIVANRAMTKFTFSGETYEVGEGPPVTMETSMIEADFSNKVLGISGAIMLAAFLPKCQ